MLTADKFQRCFCRSHRSGVLTFTSCVIVFSNLCSQSSGFYLHIIRLLCFLVSLGCREIGVDRRPPSARCDRTSCCRLLRVPVDNQWQHDGGRDNGEFSGSLGLQLASTRGFGEHFFRRRSANSLKKFACIWRFKCLLSFDSYLIPVDDKW